MKRIRRGGAVRVLVTLSALSAIGIILGKFLAFNITEFMRFSLENLTIIFSGIVFGPLLGAAVGAGQDLVGCLAVGYTINPIITLGSMAIGAISGGIFALTKRLSPSVRILLCALSAHLIGSVLIKSIGLAIFYSLPFYGDCIMAHVKLCDRRSYRGSIAEFHPEKQTNVYANK